MLNDKDERFCQLYINGAFPYVGDVIESFGAVFPELATRNDSGVLANEYVRQPHIRERIEELVKENGDETENIKRFLKANLIQIVRETSSKIYKDRKGREVSPAALRSVAVNAAKALMDMYPIKAATVNKLDLGSDSMDGCQITFNVIAPEKKDKNNGEEQQ